MNTRKTFTKYENLLSFVSMAIHISGLSKTYSNGVSALKNINVDIQQGDFFALLGANGAGKTTLIGIITSLVNKTAGKVIINDIDLDVDPRLLRSIVGVVPQEFNFNIFETPLEIILNQAGYYGISRTEAMPFALELLEKLALSEKKDVPSQTLSGGMKRRLMIARALIHKPTVLLLDEPTAGVDVELRVGMWEYLKQLNADGVTILLTTHYLEEVEQLCNNAAIIKDGEIIKMDSVKNLLNSLQSEPYRIELSEKTEITEKMTNSAPFKLVFIDSTTLEVSINESTSLQQVIDWISSQKLNISGIRPKGNRLEELFLSLVAKPD